MPWDPATYFASPERKIDADPVLVSISFFRRYGPNDCFEFSAAFEHPEGKKNKKCWVKYKDLACNPAYVAFLEEYNWNIEDEQEKYYEELDRDDDNYSDEDPVTRAPAPKKPLERSTKGPKKHAFGKKRK